MIRIARRLNDRFIFVLMGILIPLFVLLPFSQVLSHYFKPVSLYYETLVSSNAIWKSVIVTIEMIFKVGIVSSILGFGLAYIITFYKLRFRRIWNILFIVPLAIPVYVAAYTYTNIYFYIPFLETLLKNDFFMNGSVFIYSFFLYPYVYLASKSYLKRNLSTYIEASKTLGKNEFQTLYKVVLPLSRPVIIGSVLFSIFEALSDFAVVEYYGVLSLSRYINLAWQSNGDFVSASRFSVYIMFIMFIFIFSERMSRRNKKYSGSEVIHRPIIKQEMNPLKKIIVYIIISCIVLLSSVLPILQMIVSAINTSEYIADLDILITLYNSIRITLISIVFIVSFGLILATITIYIKGIKKHVISTISTIGYVIPSMVIALGAYMVFIRIDQWLYRTFNGIGLNTMLITSGITIIVIGFFIKFFSIAYTNLLSAYGKIDHKLLEASETLGENRLSTMFRVNIPLLKRSILAVSIILFIEMFKELTIVYSLRPFNFKTLSTEVYRYAGNEMINVAAFPSLIIICICIILIIYLEEGFKHVRTKKH